MEKQNFGNKIKLSVILPCYDEESNLERIFNAIENYKNQEDIEFILVENGSHDKSRAKIQAWSDEKARKLAVYVEQNQGYGYGIQQGLAVANGIFVCWFHADLQVSLDEIKRVYDYLNESQWNEKIFIKGLRSKEDRSFTENIMSNCMAIVCSAICRMRLNEINGIPSVYPVSYYKHCRAIPNDVMIELYLYYHAKVVGLLERRMKVKYHKREFGNTKLLPDVRSKLKGVIKTIKFCKDMVRKASL